MLSESNITRHAIVAYREFGGVKLKHETEIELIDELLGLRKAKSAYLDEKITHSPIERYTNPERFARERAEIFSKFPVLIAHVSELPEEGSFLTKSFAGIPILLTRDREGEIHSFYNVCRHRGARLVEADHGCKHRFSCPYHAWTWDNAGELIAAPHREQGFPDLDFSKYGLKRLQSAVRNGWVWITIDQTADNIAIDNFLAPLKGDMNWLEMDNLEIHDVSEKDWNCNWKIVVEGGLEAYHFRVAHTKTIAALFHDNLSTYRVLGHHIRSVLARINVDDFVEIPRKDWNVRACSNLLYTIFPSTAWLVQSDHVVLVQFSPISASKTKIRLATLIPKQAEPLTENQQNYWDKNHALTCTTLYEDFEMGEKIQAGLELGVNEQLTFGRFEGALDQFNSIVDSAL